jgi:penicillin-binding protein activator
MARISLRLLCFGTAIFATACASAPVVQYQDASAVETLTADFGTTDAQLIIEKMVGSLLSSPVFGTERPVVWVYPVKNKTSEHIDTKRITDGIRTQGLKSGLVRFTAASDVANELQDQLAYQDPSSGIVDPETRRQAMRQIGAKFALYGEIGSIVKVDGRSRVVDYHVTMNLADIETGLIEWADEKTIRKGVTRRLVGD